ncbi:cation-translocating P-type ATPase [Gallaecimonas kandeliae]|uniref:cation-translocating P-type ATPase n=1 Tax=Gallaecimonas kandeliae TaxID=3029055 RepID=UPI00264811EE|nr:cation-translocating P-type ATPase [Gallaecimonas kandeliae]WKE66900.1 cation-translocating P-type ATPase [Gallaecimonas kandeliae]
MPQPQTPESFQGLSSQEAKARLERLGPNALPVAQRRSLFSLLAATLREPILLLLLACELIYFILGDTQEALVLLGFVALILAIGLYQEWKTERSLDRLRELSSPRALVIRDGQRQRIAGQALVEGDLLVLAEGDRVAADARLCQGGRLSLDESLLTGESLPVAKDKAGDSVYAGTLVVQGQGLAEVVATGERSQLGLIGKSLQALPQEETPRQKETRAMVARLSGLAIAVCLLVALLHGLRSGDWLQGLLAGLALAMAILPNEIPVVLAIFLALGAWRFSRHRVLTRRLAVVEALGAITVLCVDKTGTLTFNRMAVRQLNPFRQGRFVPLDLDELGGQALPEAVHDLVEFGILASRKEPFDPMEKALRQLGQEQLASTEHLHDDWRLCQEYPLSNELLAMSCVWESENGELHLAAKGAPEAIASLCHLDRDRQALLAGQVQAMAASGLRVLGVARGRQKAGRPQLHPALPQSRLGGDRRLPLGQHDFEFEFLGLVGLADPLRPSTAPALAQCRQAGIRVLMLTGDHPATALEVARQAGLAAGDMLTGEELAALSDEALASRLEGLALVARVMPEQKLRLVQALKAAGEVVAMTGDGVNDAPALKAAHVGIAMGERGTDVAREAADLVLLEDDFRSIVAAIALGRRVFDNLRKAMVYVLAVHLPILGMSLLPVLLGWPLVLLPVHIAFLHLVIDPACTLVFEAEAPEPALMRRPPQAPGEPLFDRSMLGLALAQGLSVLLILLAVFATAFYWGQGEADARALAFTTLIVANLATIVANRSWSKPLHQTLGQPNAALWWVLGGTLLFLALVLYVPALRTLFSFSLLHPLDLLLSLVAGGLGLLWFELLKLRRA